MLVMIDNPYQEGKVGRLYGGAVSAPVFKVVSDRIVAYDIRMHASLQAQSFQPTSTTGLLAGYADDLHTIGSAIKITHEPSTEGWVEATPNGNWKSRPTRSGQVPDVRGLTLRDALFLLENRGFRVSTEGHGKVKEQSVAPGVDVAKTTRKSITLRLG